MERHVHLSVRSNAHISGHPIHPMLVPFPIALLIGAFVTDLVYVFSGDSFWIMMSFWLIAAGVAMALLAAIPGAAELFGPVGVLGYTVLRSSYTPCNTR